MKRSLPWLLVAALFACCMVLAGLGFHLEVLRQEHAARIQKLEGDVRSALGKLYDQQERQSEELDAAEGRASIELWKARAELETCRKGGK
jgi:hypothetical protein